MEKFIAKYFTSWYYYELKNGKLLHIESAFVYMLLACMIFAVGVLQTSGLALIPFAIPFVFGASVIFNGFTFPYWFEGDTENGGLKLKYFKIKYYPFVSIETLRELGAWRTQLKTLKSKSNKSIELTAYEFLLMKELEDRWIETYGEPFRDTPYAKIVKFVPWLLFLGALIIAQIFGN